MRYNGFASKIDEGKKKHWGKKNCSTMKLFSLYSLVPLGNLIRRDPTDRSRAILTSHWKRIYQVGEENFKNGYIESRTGGTFLFNMHNYLKSRTSWSIHDNPVRSVRFLGSQLCEMFGCIGIFTVGSFDYLTYSNRRSSLDSVEK